MIYVYDAIQVAVLILIVSLIVSILAPQFRRRP